MDFAVCRGKYEWMFTKDKPDKSSFHYGFLAGRTTLRQEYAESLGKVRELIAPWCKSHQECQDPWYSCPKHESYIREAGGTECDCSTEDLQAAIARLDALLSATGEGEK